jgi:signal transduction histidine kinase
MIDAQKINIVTKHTETPDETKSTSLVTLETTPNQRRLATIIAAVIIASAFLLFPFVSQRLLVLEAFIPMFIPTIFFCDIITAFLLWGQFAADRRPALAVLTATYIFSALLTVAYLLSFPGIFSETGLFGANPQTTSWLWIFWHGGFPLGILAYLGADYAWRDRQLSGKSALWLFVGLFLAVGALVLGLCVIAYRFNDWLPVFVSGSDYSRVVTSGVGPTVWLITTLALVGLLYRGRGQTVLQLWLSVGLIAWLIDTVLSLSGGVRYSVGWYGSRINTLFTSVVVLVALLYEVSQLYYKIARREREQRFLAEASATLGASLDYVTNLQNVARLVVQSNFATSCIFDIYETEQNPPRLQRVATAHADPRLEQMVTELNRRFPPDPTQQPIIGQILETGQPQIIGQFNQDFLRTMSNNPSELTLLRHVVPDTALCAPLIARGKTIGILGLGLHATARKYGQQDIALAEQLAQRAALAIDNARLYEQTQQALDAQKELDRLKDQFMSIASHELRTPLTAIKGYSQLLETTINKQLENPAPQDGTNRQFLDKNVKFSRQIGRQSERMQELINRLLDFSRLQSGRLELHLTPNVHLEELLESVIEQQQVGSNTHNLVFERSSAPVIISCDVPRVEQVFNNLISNAFKYSPDGTTVTVRLSADTTKNEAVISIQDEGEGISPEHQARIFEQFYRVRNQNSLSVDGLGLGLFISHEMVTQHGGRMWVESEVSKGSTFYVALPLSN